MKVELLDYTGNYTGHVGSVYISPAQFAACLLIYTKNTRLEQKASSFRELLGKPYDPEELAYIAKTIRSSWEFVDYTFQVTGVSRAFTHQMVRTRTASYAQQSQRSVDMEGFADIRPDSINTPFQQSIWNMCMRTINQFYGELIKSGISPQDARGVLPTNVSTNIIVKCNLRTLADLVGKRDNARAQGEYVQVIRAMAAHAQEVHPWVKDFLYPERSQTPALDALLAKTLGDRSPASVPELNAVLKEIDMLKGIWG